MQSFSAFDNDEFENAPADRPKSVVPDGDYLVEIKSAELKATKAGDMFSLKLILIGDTPYNGKELEHQIWFQKKEGTEEEKEEFRKGKITEFKHELKVIGFDVDSWKKANGQPFDKMIAIACDVMIGVHLMVRQKTSTDGRFVNVYVNKRMADSDKKPAKFGPADLKVAQGAAAFSTGTETKTPW